MAWTIAFQNDSEWVLTPWMFWTKGMADAALKDIRDALGCADGTRVQEADEADIPRVNGCCLCGKPAVGLGVWIPSDQTERLMGVPKDKNRLIFYGLCEECERLPGREDMVEAKFLARPQVARSQVN